MSNGDIMKRHGKRATASLFGFGVLVVVFMIVFANIIVVPQPPIEVVQQVETLHAMPMRHDQDISKTSDDRDVPYTDTDDDRGPELSGSLMNLLQEKKLTHLELTLREFGARHLEDLEHLDEKLRRRLFMEAILGASSAGHSVEDAAEAFEKATGGRRTFFRGSF